MKKRTRILAILMALCTMVGVLSGCSAEKKPAAAVEPKNRLEAIKARGYIEVATEPAFAPFEFIDPSKKDNEKYVGSDMKLAKYIADKLGVELRIVPLEFSAVLSSITEKKYDLAISGLSYTPARAEAMNMSKGYYFSKNLLHRASLCKPLVIGRIKHPQHINPCLDIQLGVIMYKYLFNTWFFY